jgi:cation diffusion facilitator family transporter
MGTSKRIKLIPDYGSSYHPEVRARYGYLEASVSILVNVALFLLKLFFGLFINSIALIADSVHSLSDVATSGVVIFGFRVAKKKPDASHPFGHGRAEYIATLIIAILLIITGLEFVQQSIERIINLETILHQNYVIFISIIVLITAVVKEILARFSYAIAKRIKSDVLNADAWHHRTDALSSIGVALGILGSHFGFPILDPIFGLLVSFIIIYVGINLVKTSSNFLLGQAPDRQLIHTIERIAKETRGIHGVHDISLHDYGTKKVITLHAEVDNSLKLEKAHELADVLEEQIQQKTDYMTIIHLEPAIQQTKVNFNRKLLENFLQQQQEIVSFHNIKIITTSQGSSVKMHLVVKWNMSIDESHNLSHKLKTLIQQMYGPIDVDIHFEPCDQNCPVCGSPCKQQDG